MRSYFITGGTGFIGRAIVRRLLGQGVDGPATITLLTRDAAQFARHHSGIAAHPRVMLLEGDVRALPTTTARFTDIIHAATDANDRLQADRLRYLSTIADGTKASLELAASCGCERFVMVSSGAIYGDVSAHVRGVAEAVESAPHLMDVAAVYGHGKRYAEHLCALYAAEFRIEVKIARVFAVIGDEMPLSGQYAAGNFIRDALDPLKDSIVVKGDGTPLRSYLNVVDVADWIVRILDQGRPVCPYNVGSDTALTICDLASLVARLVSPEKKVLVSQPPEHEGRRSAYLPDCSLIKGELGVSETISVAESIVRVRDYIVNRPSRLTDALLD